MVLSRVQKSLCPALLEFELVQFSKKQTHWINVLLTCITVTFFPFAQDFGDYSESYYSVQTTEGETISQLIAGYIDIILKKVCLFVIRFSFCIKNRTGGELFLRNHTIQNSPRHTVLCGREKG